MFCDQCGSENPNHNKYCGECGAKVEPANGKAPEPVHAPIGPVSSAFRREVEQQQLRLQRLEEQPVRSYSDLATSSAESAPDAETMVDRPSTTSEEATVVRTREDATYPTSLEQATYPADETAYEPTQDTISGPSFLGLSGPAPSERQDLSYLYEDDAKPGRARKMLALVIALGFIAFIGYEWKQNPNWQTTIVGKLRKSQANAGASNVPPAESASAAQSPASASPAQTANSETSREQASSAVPNGAAQQSSQKAGTPLGPSASSLPANGPGSSDDQNPVSAQATPRPDKSVAETNSTGSVGEQEAVDTENADAVAKPAPERTTAKKPGSTRTGRTTTQAKAEQPDEALVKKADAFLYGRGVPRNCQQALVYLRTAANRGNAMARSRLGGLYATGHCVPLDRAEAYNWFTLSRDAGGNNVWVQRNREILWTKMTADEKARAMEPPR